MNQAGSKVRIGYYSDVLCVWAYAGQIKLDELKRRCGEHIELSYHFIPVFGSVASRIARSWSDRGGYAGYGAHVREIASHEPHIEVHSQIWVSDPPASSAGCHAFLKAIQLLENEGLCSKRQCPEFEGRTVFEEAIWRMRRAFFHDAVNVAMLDRQLAIASGLGLSAAAIRAKIDDGSAYAALCEDMETQRQLMIDGSPTYVLNEGRQKLYGNVGYRVIEANVMELLHHAEHGEMASWC